MNKPCKTTDQERNEEGKCVKKCAPDQVRDPITKRCRKINQTKKKNKITQQKPFSLNKHIYFPLDSEETEEIKKEEIKKEEIKKEEIKKEEIKKEKIKKNACKPDQERNEEGKCVKKCLPNQVRDPVTKRCRKIKDGNNLNKVVKKQTQKQSQNQNKTEKIDDTVINALDKVELTKPQAEPKKKRKCMNM